MTHFIHSYLFAAKKRVRCVLLFWILISSIFLFSSCHKKTVDYFSYVSELRQNVFLAETEEFSLKIYTGFKESPYLADGKKREINPRTEIFLTALWQQIMFYKVYKLSLLEILLILF